MNKIYSVGFNNEVELSCKKIDKRSKHSGNMPTLCIFLEITETIYSFMDVYPHAKVFPYCGFKIGKYFWHVPVCMTTYI